MGEAQLPSSQLAIVDSGSTYVVGPNDAVGEIAEINGATCFVRQGDDENPINVPCDSPEGFDAAAIQCDKPFYDLVFKIDGETYRLSKEDLLMDIETVEGVCILRLQGSNEMQVGPVAFRVVPNAALL